MTDAPTVETVLEKQWSRERIASVGHASGFELTREPIPTNGQPRGGKWIAVIEAAREAAAQGECVVFAGNAKLFNSARSTLYGHRKLLPTEKIHIHQDTQAGVVRVWISNS